LVSQVLGGLRFLATDRYGLLLLLWGVVAFVVRPALLAAHAGAVGWPYAEIRNAMDPVALAHTASVIQWVAFTGLVALAVIAHIRYSTANPAAFAGDASRFRIAAAYALLLMAGYLLFLWSPASVFTIITHDSLIFFDSTYRISNGLVPSSDFPTALGAAQLYLPAWAAWLIGGYGGSVELASVWVAVGLGLACAAIGAQRMPIAVTAVLLGVVFLVTVPAAMLERWGGESQTLVNGETEILADNLSWAMFYNRWGWAALIPLFMVLVPRRDRSTAPGLGEIAVLAAVLTFLFWLKVSYFAAGLGAAAVYAFLNPGMWRTLAIGGAMTAAGIVAIGLMTGNLLAYINDILLAGKGLRRADGVHSRPDPPEHAGDAVCGSPAGHPRGPWSLQLARRAGGGLHSSRLHVRHQPERAAGEPDRADRTGRLWRCAGHGRDGCAEGGACRRRWRVRHAGGLTGAGQGHGADRPRLRHPAGKSA
jgi:hypothetical protein